MPKVSDTCAYLAPERNSDTGGTRPRLRTEQQGVLVARWVSAAPELDPGPDMGDLVFALFGDRPIPDEHDARHLRPLRQHARILPRKCRLPRRARRRSPLRILQRHRSRTLRSIAPYPSIPCPHMLAVCWQRQLCDRSPCSLPTPDPDRARRASPWIRGSDTSAPAPLSSCRLSSRVQILRGLSVSVLVCLCPCRDCVASSRDRTMQGTPIDKPADYRPRRRWIYTGPGRTPTCTRPRSRQRRADGAGRREPGKPAFPNRVWRGSRVPHRCISTQYQLVLYQWRGAQRAPRARARARARPSSALAKHADPCTSPRSSACADGTGRDAHTTGVAKECDPRGPARAVLIPYVVPCSSDHTLLIDDPGALERRRSLGQTTAVQCSADQCQCRCRPVPVPVPGRRSGDLPADTRDPDPRSRSEIPIRKAKASRGEH